MLLFTPSHVLMRILRRPDGTIAFIHKEKGFTFMEESMATRSLIS